MLSYGVERNRMMEEGVTPALMLPPGFLAIPAADDLWPLALAAAAAGEPGSVFWDGSAGCCRAAFVFEPDRSIDAGALLDLGLLALFDAIALLAPPRLPLTIALPDRLMVDGATVATLRAAIGPGLVPTWAVLGLDVAVDLQGPSPGERPDRTCLAEEGFGAVTPAQVLEYTSRSLLGWIDAWREEGPAILARTVAQRGHSVAVSV